MPKGAVPGGENGEAFVPLLSVNTSFLLNLLQRGVMNWSLISILSRKNYKGVSPESMSSQSLA